MRDYFGEEMRLLRQRTEEFASKYPREAAVLSLRGMPGDGNPHIERLLEGVAFLTARVKQRIDDDLPEISERLLFRLWPHLLRPFPAVTIVHFASRSRQLQQTYRVEKGTVLQSTSFDVDSEKMSCKFTTTESVKVNPLQLKKASITNLSHDEMVLMFYFQVEHGVILNELDLSELRFYLRADFKLAITLFHILVSKVRSVEVFFFEKEIMLGGQEAINPAGFSKMEFVLPDCPEEFHDFHLLHEYLLFPEKYLFFDLEGLEGVVFPEECSGFTVKIKTDSVYLLTDKVTEKNFCLQCVPAVNLYSTNCEPIRLTQYEYEYPVIVNMNTRNREQFYGFEEIIGIDNMTAKRINYSEGKIDDSSYYIASRKDGYYLVLEGRREFRAETLSCQAIVNNMNYPRSYLTVGDIKIPDTVFPGFIEFTNITTPTRICYPPWREGYNWSLVTHLIWRCTVLTDLRLEKLQELFNFYNWSGNVRNRQRISGIVKLESTTINRIEKGMFKQVMLFMVIVQEKSFISAADIYLFGSVIYWFFRKNVSINHVVEVVIRCLPSGKELRCP